MIISARLFVIVGHLYLCLGSRNLDSWGQIRIQNETMGVTLVNQKRLSFWILILTD